MIRRVWILPIILAMVAIACGSDDGVEVAESVDRVETGTRVFDRDGLLGLDDLVTLGLKSGKEYDVSTLPGGVEAGRFFWRVDNVAVEYEARFYKSHDDAVSLGTGPAEEGSGADAVIDADEAVYKEGIRDRGKVFHYGNATLQPKYGAYAIYGNMVVLCEGKDDAEAWNICAALIEALDSR